ncbi:hypothetical protein QQZ08_005850 [Neonectria magnoliae]|uniref:Uncharacterized protein n=1 Tax=Neonectria magnoliae TaxID=2732573 RepID=A0ABR1I1Z7_9HYPO
MDEMPADEISIHQIHAGDGDGADIIFDSNGQLIAVSIFPSSSIRGEKHRSVNDHLIGLLGRAVSADMDDDDYDEVVDEVLGVILDAGRDLQSFLSPARLTFQLLETARGTATVVPIVSRGNSNGDSERFHCPFAKASGKLTKASRQVTWKRCLHPGLVLSIQHNPRAEYVWIATDEGANKLP